MIGAPGARARRAIRRSDSSRHDRARMHGVRDLVDRSHDRVGVVSSGATLRIHEGLKKRTGLDRAGNPCPSSPLNASRDAFRRSPPTASPAQRHRKIAPLRRNLCPPGYPPLRSSIPASAVPTTTGFAERPPPRSRISFSGWSRSERSSRPVRPRRPPYSASGRVRNLGTDHLQRLGFSILESTAAFPETSFLSSATSRAAAKTKATQSTPN